MRRSDSAASGVPAGVRMERSELCFPQLGNLSCRKSSSAPEQVFLYRVLSGVLLPPICAATVLLNLLVIVAISHFRQLHTPTNLLLLSLSVADLLGGLLMIPTQFYSWASCWLLGDTACALFLIILITVTSASVGNMVLISADRYVAICDPLHYRVKVTVRRIRACVCLCWLSSLLYACVICEEQLARPGKFRSCYGECVLTLDDGAGAADVLVAFALPLATVAALYGRVFAAAALQARALRPRVQRVRLRRSVLPRANRSELKAAKTLGVLVLVFLMCFCPYYVAAFVQGSSETSPLRTFLLHVYFFNSCINPLIYTLFYPWFRRAVRLIVALRILRPGSRWVNLQ
ncbi:trace amine-associated receptor 13c-like [Hippocampus comes]|uniref:trace amine-associated receptor 13c-like n=1 Tax=Hippocampus comes TaxID=109280 RepID=UPI00094EAE84|nr:PREDICTED: trace amine-associated receptor 13c-like [Hippocampus comes]